MLVPDNSNIVESTAVEPTEQLEKLFSDSSTSDNDYVQTHVADSENDESVQVQNNFLECANSKISFFSCNSSVESRDNGTL